MKIFIFPEENLDRFYERTLNYLNAKYHSNPSNLGSKGCDPNQFALDAQAASDARDWDGLMGREQHRKR